MSLNKKQLKASPTPKKLRQPKDVPYVQGPIIDNQEGQRLFPGMKTRIQGNTMATDGYGNIPLYVVPDVGKPRVIQPNSGTHGFPGASHFIEYPMINDRELNPGRNPFYAKPYEENIDNIGWFNPDFYGQPVNVDIINAERKERKRQNYNYNIGIGEFLQQYPTEGGYEAEQLKYNGDLMKNGGWLNKYQEGGWLDTYDIPKAQDGYVKGKSERAFRNITPQGYGDLTYNLKRYSDYKLDKGRDKNDLLWWAKGEKLEDGTKAKEDIYYTIPKRDDAFAKYLGLPQNNNSFIPSDYKPTESSDPSAIYSKPAYWNDKIKQDIIENYFQRKSSTPIDSKVLLNERSLFDSKTDSLKEAGVPWSNPETAKWILDNPLGDFTSDMGQDEAGNYISIYDKWDLNPFNSSGEGPSVNKEGDNLINYLQKMGKSVNPNTEMSELFGAGKPFEVYDRIYYDPDTKKITNPKIKQKPYVEPRIISGQSINSPMQTGGQLPQAGTGQQVDPDVAYEAVRKGSIRTKKGTSYAISSAQESLFRDIVEEAYGSEVLDELDKDDDTDYMEQYQEGGQKKALIFAENHPPDTLWGTKYSDYKHNIDQAPVELQNAYNYLEHSNKLQGEQLTNLYQKYPEGSMTGWDKERFLWSYLKGYFGNSNIVNELLEIAGKTEFSLADKIGLVNSKLEDYGEDPLKGKIATDLHLKMLDYDKSMRNQDEFNRGFQKIDKDLDHVVNYFQSVNSNPKVNPKVVEAILKNDPFKIEAGELKSVYNKSEPKTNTEVVPVWGLGDTNMIKSKLKELGPQDDVTIMGHHGDMFGHIPTKDWGRWLTESKQKNCYLGSCHSEDLATTDFKNVKNFNYRPHYSWLGVNPNSSNVLDAMYSTGISGSRGAEDGFWRSGPAIVKPELGKEYAIHQPYQEYKEAAHDIKTGPQLGYRPALQIQQDGGSLPKAQDGKTLSKKERIDIFKKEDAISRDFNYKYATSPNYTRLLKGAGYSQDEINTRISNVVSQTPDLTNFITKKGVPSNANYNKRGVSNINYNLRDIGDPDWNPHDIAAHEWGHIGVDNVYNQLKPVEQHHLFGRLNPLGTNFTPGDFEHDSSPQENRADLLWLRQQLQENKNKEGKPFYDSFKGEPFNKEILNQFREMYPDKWNRMFRLYEDDSIEYLMNNVAQGNSENALDTARNGGQPGHYKRGLKRGTTHKNIQSSINQLFLRNPDVFGPSGRKIYSPLPKAQDGITYVSDPNDPRLKSYTDSVFNNLIGKNLNNVLAGHENYDKVHPGSKWDIALQNWVKSSPTGLQDNAVPNPDYPETAEISRIMELYRKYGNKSMLPTRYQGYVPTLDNTAKDLVTTRGFWESMGLIQPRTPGSFNLPQWKEPVNKVEFRAEAKEEPVKKLEQKSTPAPKQQVASQDTLKKLMEIKYFHDTGKGQVPITYEEYKKLQGFQYGGIPRAQEGEQILDTGYHPNFLDESPKVTNVKNIPGRAYAEKMYNTVAPTGYADIANHYRYLTDKKRTDFNETDPISEEGYKQYLGINDNPKYLSKSEYKPSVSTDPNASYFRLPDSVERNMMSYGKKMYSQNNIVNEMDLSDEDVLDYNNYSVLGNVKISKGNDEKGDYISYYDKYDFPDYIQNKLKGKPFEFYNRMYLPKEESAWDQALRLEAEKKAAIEEDNKNLVAHKHGGSLPRAQEGQIVNPYKTTGPSIASATAMNAGKQRQQLLSEDPSKWDISDYTKYGIPETGVTASGLEDPLNWPAAVLSGLATRQFTVPMATSILSYGPPNKTWTTGKYSDYSWAYRADPNDLKNIKKLGGSLPRAQDGVTTQDSLDLYNFTMFQKALEKESDYLPPSFLDKWRISPDRELSEQGRENQRLVTEEANRILNSNPNLKIGIANGEFDTPTRRSYDSYGSYDIYSPDIQPKGTWIGYATNNDYSNVKPKGTVGTTQKIDYDIQEVPFEAPPTKQSVTKKVESKPVVTQKQVVSSPDTLKKLMDIKYFHNTESGEVPITYEDYKKLQHKYGGPIPRAQTGIQPGNYLMNSDTLRSGPLFDIFNKNKNLEYVVKNTWNNPTYTPRINTQCGYSPACENITPINRDYNDFKKIETFYKDPLFLRKPLSEKIMDLFKSGIELPVINDYIRQSGGYDTKNNLDLKWDPHYIAQKKVEPVKPSFVRTLKPIPQIQAESPQPVLATGQMFSEQRAIAPMMKDTVEYNPDKTKGHPGYYLYDHSGVQHIITKATYDSWEAQGKTAINRTLTQKRFGGPLLKAQPGVNIPQPQRMNLSYNPMFTPDFSAQASKPWTAEDARKERERIVANDPSKYNAMKDYKMGITEPPIQTDYTPEMIAAAIMMPAARFAGRFSGLKNFAADAVTGSMRSPKPGVQVGPNFKSEINWANWNKEIPNDAEVLADYHNIEKTTKANGTWMKNEDGSTFEGSPEEFIVPQGKFFKQAYPEGYDSYYRGSQSFDPTLQSSLRGKKDNHILFGTDNKTIAERYATNGGYNLDYLFKDIGAKPDFFHPDVTKPSTYTGYADAVNPGLYNYAIPKQVNQLEGNGFNDWWYNVDNKEVLNWLKQTRPHDARFTPEVSNYKSNMVSTDDVAAYMIEKGVPSASLKNVVDGRDLDGNLLPSTISLVNPNKVGIKSLKYNNGRFDMTNPNIYKGLVPGAVIGTAAYSGNGYGNPNIPTQKYGGWLDNYNE